MTSDYQGPSGVVAARIRAVRRKRELTVSELAQRCADAGFPELTEAALYNLEGRRTGKRPPRPVSVDELLALSRVLQVAPVHLLVPPDVEDEPYHVTPDVTAPARQVRYWVRGYELLPGDSRQLYLTEVPPGEFEEVGGLMFPTDQLWQLRLRKQDALRKQAAEQLAPQPVVAAIVTSDRGVLAGRRRDGKPPWTFIAGEQDAVQDESPVDTAIREVKEETGLRIEAGPVIGERVHPETHRRMIYIAAVPTHGTEIFVGDEEELAEVRWLSLAEADELLPGMFGPVREHLARELGTE